MPRTIRNSRNEVYCVVIPGRVFYKFGKYPRCPGKGENRTLNRPGDRKRDGWGVRYSVTSKGIRKRKKKNGAIVRKARICKYYRDGRDTVAFGRFGPSSVECVPWWGGGGTGLVNYLPPSVGPRERLGNDRINAPPTRLLLAKVRLVSGESRVLNRT